MTDNTYFARLGDAIEEEEKGSTPTVADDKFVTLANGVVLEIRGISPFLFAQVERRFPEPPVPKVFIEEKGREEENPLDPDYVRMCREVEERRAEAIVDLVVGYGTRVVSIPDGLPKPEDDDWLLGLEGLISDSDFAAIREKPHLRHLAWVKFVAIGTQRDIQEIVTRVYRRLGASSQDVSEALKSFQSDQTRSTDSGVQAST